MLFAFENVLGVPKVGSTYNPLDEMLMDCDNMSINSRYFHSTRDMSFNISKQAIAKNSYNSRECWLTVSLMFLVIR